MADLYDVLYAPAGDRPDCWYVHLPDFPHHRMDVAGYEFIEPLTVRRIVQWTASDPTNITVRLRPVSHIEGRDAPLHVQAPSEIDMMRRLDTELEATGDQTA